MCECADVRIEADNGVARAFCFIRIKSLHLHPQRFLHRGVA